MTNNFFIASRKSHSSMCDANSSSIEYQICELICCGECHDVLPRIPCLVLSCTWPCIVWPHPTSALTCLVEQFTIHQAWLGYEAVIPTSKSSQGRLQYN